MAQIPPPGSLHSGSYHSTRVRNHKGESVHVHVPLYDPLPAAGPRTHRHTRHATADERHERSLIRQQKRERARQGPDQSRRRRRWENDHFVGVPVLGAITEQDWAPCTHHAPVRWDLVSSHCSAPSPETSASPTRPRHADHPLPKGFRAAARRANAGSVVHSLETIVRSVLSSSADPEMETGAPEMDQGFVLVRHQHSDNTKLELDAPSGQAASYLRFWIHKLAMYYGVHSHSVQVNGKRVACLEHRNYSLDHSRPWLSDILGS